VTPDQTAKVTKGFFVFFRVFRGFVSARPLEASMFVIRAALRKDVDLLKTLIKMGEYERLPG
jgi:hypothetical protein